MERTVHRGMIGVTLDNEIFTDFDFADNVALLLKMLEVLVLALTIMHKEAAAFGLQINWSKTKIIQFGNPAPCPTVQVGDGLVEVVDSFVYLGSMIDSSGDNRGKIFRRIGLARTCMQQLNKKI